MSSSTTVKVQPLVLLNVVDHVTRFHLTNNNNNNFIKAEPSLDTALLPTAGLLMGTTSAADAAAAAASDNVEITAAAAAATVTTLVTSFELPLKLGESGEPLAVTTTSGNTTFMVHVVEEQVDWQVARQHREQLNAVMPESSVVGCYVVCSGARSDEGMSSNALPKKPRSELARAKKDGDAQTVGLHGVASSLATQLRKAALLSATAEGFVLLVLYDGDVCATHANSTTEQTSTPTSTLSLGALRRLPFDAFWVPTSGDGDTAAVQTEGEAAAVAVPVPASVAPADMEWIGLTNEAHDIHEATTAAASPAGGRASTSPITPLTGKPGFLRRCGAALLSASAVPALAGPPTTGAATTTTATASAQSRSAAEGLMSSLHVLRRILDTAQDASTASTDKSQVAERRGSGSNAELLRMVATCVRNVPSNNNHQIAASAPEILSSASSTPSSSPSEDILRAVLAMEAQCAMQLADLQNQVRSIVATRKTAMNAIGRSELPPLASLLMPSMAAKRASLQVGRPFTKSDEEASTATCAADGDFVRYALLREGRGQGSFKTVLYGYASMQTDK
jgi:uncharacterized protein (UPF0333 family)